MFSFILVPIDLFNVDNDNEYDDDSTQVPDKLIITNYQSRSMFLLFIK